MTTRVIVFAHVGKDQFSVTAPISDAVYLVACLLQIQPTNKPRKAIPSITV